MRVSGLFNGFSNSWNEARGPGWAVKFPHRSRSKFSLFAFAGDHSVLFISEYLGPPASAQTHSMLIKGKQQWRGSVKPAQRGIKSAVFRRGLRRFEGHLCRLGSLCTAQKQSFLMRTQNKRLKQKSLLRFCFTIFCCSGSVRSVFCVAKTVFDDVFTRTSPRCLRFSRSSARFA